MYSSPEDDGGDSSGLSTAWPYQSRPHKLTRRRPSRESTMFETRSGKNESAREAARRTAEASSGACRPGAGQNMGHVLPLSLET